MHIRASASVKVAMILSLGPLAACGDDASTAREVGREAPGEQIERFDPRLAAHLPPNTTTEAAEQGRELFLVCATCHGPDARGTQLGPSLRDQEWINISGGFEEIQRVIREGVPEPEEFPIPMPAGGGGAFDDEQLRAVAAYVFALSRSGTPAAGP